MTNGLTSELTEHPLYQADVARVAAIALDWTKLSGKIVLIAGAAGMFGSFLVDVLMCRNRHYGLGCRVIAAVRARGYADIRFGAYADEGALRIVELDVRNVGAEHPEPADYVIHLASATHPRAYADDPIGTVLTNVVGTANLLRWASLSAGSRFLLASSVEIYGESRGDVEFFDENYCGYINCNSLRAGYPESKRAAESLCRAFEKQCGQDFAIARFARSYGPGLLRSDTKALSQFIWNAVAGEPIVMKSAGTQRFSYTHAADAVSGLLHILLSGERGEAYNVAHPSGDTSLKDLARVVAECSGTEVVFQEPGIVEKVGASPVMRALMDGSRLRGLGWRPYFDVQRGLSSTIQILKECRAG